LNEVARVIEDAVYFPYQFDFVLHKARSKKYKVKSPDVMRAPWYSGLGQAWMLHLYVMLYKRTSNPAYYDIGCRVVNSYLQLKNTGYDPWVSYVDNGGYYWIEEYPSTIPSHVLNGFLFAITYLHEFWLLKKDSQVKVLLDISIRTIIKYLPEYRTNKLDYYCLGHKVQSKKYHHIHRMLLNRLYEMTNISNFL
jgi:hypothetical protein